jgi:hypothetical protein
LLIERIFLLGFELGLVGQKPFERLDYIQLFVVNYVEDWHKVLVGKKVENICFGLSASCGRGRPIIWMLSGDGEEIVFEKVDHIGAEVFHQSG